MAKVIRPNVKYPVQNFTFTSSDGVVHANADAAMQAERKLALIAFFAEHCPPDGPASIGLATTFVLQNAAVLGPLLCHIAEVSSDE